MKATIFEVQNPIKKKKKKYKCRDYTKLIEVLLDFSINYIINVVKRLSIVNNF